MSKLGPKEKSVYQCRQCGLQEKILAPGAVILKPPSKCSVCGGKIELRTIFESKPREGFSLFPHFFNQ
jgi:rubrerythrin